LEERGLLSQRIKTRDRTRASRRDKRVEVVGKSENTYTVKRPTPRGSQETIS
jgi:hypothetical protein